MSCLSAELGCKRSGERARRNNGDPGSAQLLGLATAMFFVRDVTDGGRGDGLVCG